MFPRRMTKNSITVNPVEYTRRNIILEHRALTNPIRDL